MLQRPEAVLHEPEHGVREHRVEEAVRLGVVRDEPQPHRGAGLGAHLARAGERDVPIGVAHRARDPRHVVALGERGERGDKAARPPHRVE